MIDVLAELDDEPRKRWTAGLCAKTTTSYREHARLGHSDGARGPYDVAELEPLLLALPEDEAMAAVVDIVWRSGQRTRPRLLDALRALDGPVHRLVGAGVPDTLETELRIVAGWPAGEHAAGGVRSAPAADRGAWLLRWAQRRNTCAARSPRSTSQLSKVALGQRGQG